RRPGRIGPPSIRAAATVAPSIAVPPTIAPIVSHRICHLRGHGDGTGAAAVIVQEHDRRLGGLAVTVRHALRRIGRPVGGLPRGRRPHTGLSRLGARPPAGGLRAHELLGPGLGRRDPGWLGLWWLGLRWLGPRRLGPEDPDGLL